MHQKWAWLGLEWDSNQVPPEAVTPLLGQVNGKKPGMYDKSRHALNADIFSLHNLRMYITHTSQTLQLQSTPFSFLTHFWCVIYLWNSCFTKHMTKIFKFAKQNKYWLLFIDQVMVKLQVLGNLKNHTCPSALLWGTVWFLRSPWAYNFNHAPHSSQYLYI